MAGQLIALRSATETLTFDRASGRLLSFRANTASDQEFIATAADHPAFALQYLDDSGAYQRLTSHDAATTRLSCRRQHGRTTLTMAFSGLADQQLDVIITVRVTDGEPGSRWRLRLRNGAGWRVVDIQFPYVVTRYDLHGSLLLPHYAGKLLTDPQPHTLGPDADLAWRFNPRNGDSVHYPGGSFCQLMAFYTREAGLYMACEDAAANVKLFKALHRAPGIRLGIAHVGDWPEDGERQLEYDVVLQAFTGDWYDAAEIYRSWSLQQVWGTPLHQRADVPAWLLDSPAYITLRLQGELDAGPVFPVTPFLPPSRALPQLDRLAARLEAPLAAVLMSWERGGPWVYPDCFPPAGGDDGMRAFCAAAREREWEVGSFCNGTRWVTGHAWNDYDGRAEYEQRQGETSVCRTPDGAPWQEDWDQSWRPSYAGCLGTALTRQLATDFVRRLIDWGMRSIQFFDQNMGAATFPCFATDHDHPDVPGKWMAACMRDIVAAFHAAADEAGAADIIHSSEATCNETCLPLFQECDIRVIPPGHTSDYEFLPLYHFLYHECIIIQGGMGMGPEPHHLPTRNACNLVLGQLPGAVIIGDGTLLNKDTGNWAPWEPRVGDDDDAVEVMRTALALRRGPGRDFLVFGRMQRPAAVSGIGVEEWEQASRLHRIPAVFHAAWQAPDRRHGVVLANWTTAPQRVTVRDDRLGARIEVHRVGDRLATRTRELATPGRPIRITVPPLGCALLAGAE
jgi:hypothetical protein